MKILLLSATQFEIQPFLQTAPKCDVLIGGVGSVATAYHLTKQLSHHHYNLVIQAGIGGAFTDEVKLGEVVVVKSDAFGDLGVMETEFQSIQDMYLSSEMEWLENKNPLLQKLLYKQVKAVTVNTLHTDANVIAAFREKWKADVESMEGAALHYVCQRQYVPYLQLRSISNKVGVRDKNQWRMKDAIINLNEALASVLQSIV
jgi:futalosine hydrolase